MIMCSLTNQLGFLRREKHVDIVWISRGSEVLIAVGYGGTSRPELPSVDLEGRNIRVGVGGGNLPGNVTIVGACVVSEPVEGASIVGTLGARRAESKAKGDGFSSGTAENPADNAHVGTVSILAQSQAKQARDLVTI